MITNFDKFYPVQLDLLRGHLNNSLHDTCNLIDEEIFELNVNSLYVHALLSISAQDEKLT